MPTMQSLLILVQLASITSFSVFAAQETSKSLSYRLSKPLIGDNGRIYACSEKNLFAFESNGTIAWTIHLNYKCNDGMSPVHGGIGKIYLVAENRVVKINFHNIGTAEPASEVFFGPGPGEEAQVEIIGITVSTLSSIVFISIKNRGLFAYMMHGHLLWSAGPVLYQFGYRQGCGKNATDCYFASVPFLDQCEANVYISNTEGELYCLSVHSPHFKWIRDFSSLDKVFTITPGNNGRLYVTVPVRLLVLALDVFSGNILWQRNIGPLSKAECAPVVDSNGWISIGSLDGFLYSFSPTGELKKFSRRNIKDSVVQVGPFLDCSGYAVYISQTEMERKVSRTIGQYTYISATQPKTGVFTMLVPATGSIYWSESYTGQFSSLLSKNDLAQFVVDEEILLAFAAASKTGNPLQCRSPGQRLASSCSQARTKLVSIYTGNERAILLFLLFESAVLALVAGLVRFCCTFWTKRKIQGQGLGSFLDKRRSLRLKKKAFDRTITELEQKAAEEAVANEVYEKLGDMVRERECIERKLSTTYSLGRDRTGSQSKALLPLHIGRTRSYSFQGAKKESVTIFHTLSDTSSISESSSETEMDQLGGMESATRGKEKAPTESDSSSEDEDFGRGYRRSPSEPASSSEGFMSLLGPEDSWEVKLCNKGESKSEQNTHSSLWLKRRRALSSTN